ncbi:MAG: alpha/beta hydrolase domain-containing protein [Vicinamibacterales bacterium]
MLSFQRLWHWTYRVTVIGLGIMVVATGGPGRAAAQDFDQTSCNEFRVAPRTVRDKPVGPVSCMMQETDVGLEGRTFRRLDMGIDGSVEGAVTKRSDTRAYFTNAPELVFPQIAGDGPYFSAVASYTGTRGASMTVIYPLDAASWNGKMWVTAHGGEVALGLGLLPWHRNLDRKNPLKDLNDYDRVILSKGYALVKTRRPTVPVSGHNPATGDDGTTLDGVAFTDTVRYITDFTALAARAIAVRLGRPPSQTYLYGHASGASLAHSLNYTRGANGNSGGARVFDGILADDAAAGVWLPMLLKSSQDSLLATDAERADFVPQIDVIHQMNNDVWRERKAEDLSMSALANARRNAMVLREKGLGSKTRTYEVRGISREGGESLTREPGISHVDLSQLMASMIDHLDKWVTKGTTPPATRSDSAALAGTANKEVSQHAAIALPEVACPLGVYHPYPVPTAPRTAFAPFGATDLEPLDGAGGFVDMNGNGVRDRREDATQAWRRLGLLRRGEELTQEKYTACVRASADQLRLDGFLTDDGVKWYADRASKASLSQTSQR